jgi:hypothetical protein
MDNAGGPPGLERGDQLKIKVTYDKLTKVYDIPDVEVYALCSRLDTREREQAQVQANQAAAALKPLSCEVVG